MITKLYFALKTDPITLEAQQALLRVISCDLTFSTCGKIELLLMLFFTALQLGKMCKLGNESSIFKMALLRISFYNHDKKAFSWSGNDCCTCIIIIDMLHTEPALLTVKGSGISKTSKWHWGFQLFGRNNLNLADFYRFGGNYLSVWNVFLIVR